MSKKSKSRGTPKTRDGRQDESDRVGVASLDARRQGNAGLATGVEQLFRTPPQVEPWNAGIPNARVFIDFETRRCDFAVEIGTLDNYVFVLPAQEGERQTG